MKKSFFVGLCMMLLCGAGCSLFVPSASTILPPASSGILTPEGTIAFEQGFGLLPGKNPNLTKNDIKTDVNVTADWKYLPEIPNVVTVIRKRSALPNSTVLQNITSALSMPIGTIGSNPISASMSIAWYDASGYRWSYDAKKDHLDFEKTSTTVPLTSKALATDGGLIQAVSEFVSEKGLLSNQWGSPYIVFSWERWQAERAKEERCMSSQTVNVIRKMAQESTLEYDLLPSLVSTTSNQCVKAEYPNLQVVRYSFQQDGDLVYESDGLPAISAEAYVRMDTKEIVRGWVELKKEADRSNYQAILSDRLKAYIENGGMTSFPFNAKTFEISAFNKGAYRYVADVNGIPRTFFIPAIQAQGMLTYKNGTSIPYAVVVSLVREDQFEGK